MMVYPRISIKTNRNYGKLSKDDIVNHETKKNNVDAYARITFIFLTKKKKRKKIALSSIIE